MDQNELQVIAYHEAGHAVVGRYLGFSLVDVTIQAEGDALGRASHRWCSELGVEGDEKDRLQMEKAAVILLAGPLAEERFTGQRNVGHAQGDYEMAVRIVQRFEADEKVQTAWLAYLEERARSIIWRHWRAWNEIKVLAQALIERETINGAEVLNVLMTAEDDEEMVRRIDEEGNINEAGA